MATIESPEQFEAWLVEHPTDAAVAITVRAALRVAGVSAVYIRPRPDDRAATLVLPTFRAMAFAWVARTWTSHGGKLRDAATPAVGRAAARAAGRAAADAFWAEVTADMDALEAMLPVHDLMRRPLWSSGVPGWADSSWESLKSTLLALDDNWRVWTDWYDARLRGADHPDSSPLIEALELKRVQIPDQDWERGPSWINSMIAELEAEYRSKVPPQRSAIIEVGYGEDRRLHRRSGPPPEARDEAQQQRLRDAWAAHSEQLATLEELDPGRNAPALGQAIRHYRTALGSTYEDLNVIALGVHGARLAAHAARADEQLLEDAAGELVGVAAAHGLFINQFDAWRDYLDDASGEPTPETVEAAIEVALSMRDVPELIDDDIAIPINELADAAVEPLAANPEDRPRPLVERELLRSVGNVLSGMFAPLVDYASDAGSAVREGSLDGIQDFSKQATLALAFAGSSSVLLLAAGFGEFAWIGPVVAFLKMKLKK